MYEVECKVEITEEEKEGLIKLFKERGFAAEGTDQQNDYYVEAKDSPVYEGYDLKRYRDESGTIFYTEKIWEMAGGVPARKELEHEVTREEFESEIAKFPNSINIRKRREWFAGKHGDADVSVTIDSVKFDHSPGLRYFIEAETNTNDIDEVKALKDAMIEFLKDVLGKDQIIESPGMFTMALKKR